MTGYDTGSSMTGVGASDADGGTLLLRLCGGCYGDSRSKTRRLLAGHWKDSCGEGVKVRDATETKLRSLKTKA